MANVIKIEELDRAIDRIEMELQLPNPRAQLIESK
jgi:hypothetical protein